MSGKILTINFTKDNIAKLYDIKSFELAKQKNISFSYIVNMLISYALNPNAIPRQVFEESDPKTIADILLANYQPKRNELTEQTPQPQSV